MSELSDTKFRFNGPMAKKEREYQGKSMSLMSSTTGIGMASISRIESGEYENPTGETAMKMAEFLGIAPEKFYIKESTDERNQRIREEISSKED